MKKSPMHPELGPLIERILKEKGMSKATFGRRINTSRQNVSLILKKQHMDTLLLWKICEALETDFYHLMSLAFAGSLPGNGSHPRTGTMEIRLELADTQLVHITADLVRGIVENNR